MLSGEDEENGRKDALGKRQNENRMQMEHFGTGPLMLEHGFLAYVVAWIITPRG